MLKLIYVCLLINSICFGQKLKILDVKSKVAISYATITKLDDGKGSFADENGIFTFEKNTNNKFIISCLGYQNDTIIPEKNDFTIYLKPMTYDLRSIEVIGKRAKVKKTEVGYFHAFSLLPYYASLPRKMSVCTLIPSKPNSNDWLISNVRLNIGAGKSKIYNSFIVRIFIKENLNNKPGKDLLKKDMIVSIKENSFKYTFPIKEEIIFPKNGCFVGYEVVGKIDKNNTFTPFSDLYKKPDRPFEFVSKLVKSDSYSLVKYNNFNSWFNNKRSDNKPDTYAIGLELIELLK